MKIAEFIQQEIVRKRLENDHRTFWSSMTQSAAIATCAWR
jgi:hypothetical protein